MGEWTLFSNHGHVLVCLARNKHARLRDVASDVGITERAVQKIVSELQQAGLIAITKHGRCNQYEIHGKKNLRHPLEAGCTVGRLLQLVVKSPGEGGAEPTVSRSPVKPVRQQKPAAPRARPAPELPPVPEAERSEPTTRATGKAADKSQDKPHAKPADKAAEKPVDKVANRAADKVADKVADKAAEKVAEKVAQKVDEETRKQGSLF